MEPLSQDVYYWQLIHHLVVKEKMRAFQVSSDEKEIWIEKENSNETTVIRIVRKDLTWSNEITRDIEALSKTSIKIRKQLGSRRLNILNVYVTSDQPVDFDNHSPNQPDVVQGKRIKITSYIIENNFKDDSTKQLLGRVLQTSIPNLDYELSISMESVKRFRNEVVSLSEARLKKEKALFTYGKPLFTYIILLNVLVIFGFMEYFGSSMSLLTLVEFGAKYNPLIHEGEWWRFFTSIFLHIGFLHLFMNSLALFYLGSAVERIYGTQRFVFIYIIAGFFGAISSFAFNSQISAGASGAIFGCFGALLYFGFIHRKLFFRTMGVNIIVILIINLALGFMIPMIDNGAHIGGLVGGFLASSFLHLPKHKKSPKQLVSFFVLVISISGLLFYGFNVEENVENTQLINVQISQELLQRGEIERAYILLKEAVDNEVDVVEANFLLAYSEARLGFLKDAEKNLLITIDQRPFLHEAYFNLSLVYFELRQFLDALYSVETALELNPNEQSYIDLKRTIEKQLEKIKLS